MGASARSLCRLARTLASKAHPASEEHAGPRGREAENLLVLAPEEVLHAREELDVLVHLDGATEIDQAIALHLMPADVFAAADVAVARIEREALGVVRFLIDYKKLPKAEVLKRIRADETISEPVRQKALSFAEQWRV